MASSNWGGRGQRAAGGARASRASLAQWLDDVVDEFDDKPAQAEARPQPAARRNAKKPSLDDLTAKLELLAERLNPQDDQDDEDGYVSERQSHHEQDLELNRMVAALAKRTRETEDRIASALELLTRVIAREETPAATYADNYSRPEARDFPPPPAPPPSRDDRAAESRRDMTQVEAVDTQEHGLSSVASKAEPAGPLFKSTTANASFTFVPFVVPAPKALDLPADTGVDPLPEASPPAASAPQPRLKDVVSEITARQRALAADARHDDLSRVRVLETRIAEIAAKVEATAHPAADVSAVYLTREMSDLRTAVQSLAQRVTVPLAADGSPEMLNSIYRALEGLSLRFDAQGATTMSAETLDQLRDGVEALTARLDNARPGEETRSVLNTIQRSIEHLAVRLDQAVQAPSTSEALIAMHAAIDGIGQQVSKIGNLANRSENLTSLESTIEDLIAELRSTSKGEPANPDIGTLKLSIDSLADHLSKTTSTVPAVANETLSSVERAIEELSHKLETQSPAATDTSALNTIQTAIEDLADKMERNGTSGNATEASAAIHSALEALATRIDISDQRLQKLASLEDMVQHLAKVVEDQHGSSIEAAQTAAARAIREALTELPQAGVHEEQMSALADTMIALQSQSEKAERRTVDAFESVRSTLERIIDRLAIQENAEGRGGSKPATELDPVSAARAAARRALAESNIPVEPVQDTEAGRSKRARFIAAARRATTPSLPQITTTDIETVDETQDEVKATWKSRRTLLIGLAGILLILGSFQFGKMALKSAPKATPAAEGQQPTAAVIPQRDEVPDTTPTTPAIKDTSGLATPTADPVMTGSIPAALEIPDAIGGPVLVESARKGDAAALHEIGVRYFDGDKVERDMAKAIKWFEKSAEQGFAPAQYRLANALDKGHGIAINPGQAESWYRKAADQGHIKAMHNLAVLLAEGSLGKPDYPQAGYWFRRAADRGVRDSQYNLGVMLARGLGVNQDLADAYKWFAIAASAGDTDSATKRDQVAAKLKPATLVAARLEAQTWQPLPKDALANDESAPEDGWDAPVKAAARAPQS